MIPKKITGPYVLYLLHFDRPVGRAQHYLGITKPDRLHWRMLEHSRAKGARLTAKAANMGIGFRVAATWPCDSAQDEKRFKRISHFAARCPFCTGKVTEAKPLLPFDHYPPRPQMATDLPASYAMAELQRDVKGKKKG